MRAHGGGFTGHVVDGAVLGGAVATEPPPVAVWAEWAFVAVVELPTDDDGAGSVVEVVVAVDESTVGGVSNDVVGLAESDTDSPLSGQSTSPTNKVTATPVAPQIDSFGNRTD